MINHSNQVGQNQQYRSTQRLIIANVNNKDEAMMFNVPKGYTSYLFEYNNPLFYVKSCDEFTGQISFFEYEYNEVIPQPVPDPTNFVTRDDMVGFKNDIMQSIAALLVNNQPEINNPVIKVNQPEVNSNEQHISKTDAKPARSTKGQSR